MPDARHVVAERAVPERRAVEVVRRRWKLEPHRRHCRLWPLQGGSIVRQDARPARRPRRRHRRLRGRAPVADVIADELDGHHDEHESDPLGNHFFTRRGSDGAPTVMLCAHMDELGLHRPARRGRGLRPDRARRDSTTPAWWSTRISRSTARKGAVHGVTGAKPAHVLPPDEAKKAIPIDQLHVDLGTTSREETEALGVRVGDLATFARTGMALNGTRVFSGKAVDDRAGCAVMVEVMRRLGDSPAATVVGVAAVQEELGIRGAGPAAARVKPDVGIAIDVTLCGDTPGLEFSRLPISMGEGAGDQVLRLGARGRLRERRAAAPDRPARARRRVGGRRLPARGADGRRDRRLGHRQRGHPDRLHLGAVALHPLGRRLRATSTTWRAPSS